MYRAKNAERFIRIVNAHGDPGDFLPHAGTGGQSPFVQVRHLTDSGNEEIKERIFRTVFYFFSIVTRMACIYIHCQNFVHLTRRKKT